MTEEKSEGFKVTAPALDAEALVAEIREQVARKEKSGAYDRYNLSGVVALDYEKDLNEEDFLRYHLQVVARLSDVNYGDYEIASKGGTKGKAGVLLKKLIWKLLQFYTYRLFSQQSEFDGQVSQAMISHYRWSKKEIDRLSAEVESLRRKLEEGEKPAGR